MSERLAYRTDVRGGQRSGSKAVTGQSVRENTPPSPIDLLTIIRADWRMPSGHAQMPLESIGHPNWHHRPTNDRTSPGREKSPSSGEPLNSAELGVSADIRLLSTDPLP